MRFVRKVSLNAPDETSVRGAAVLLEDALRTASIPFEARRLLIVRALDVGEIDPDRASSALAFRLEDRLRHYASTAIPASDPAAGSAPAVFFRDEIDPFVLLAVRAARGQPAREWYWRRILPVSLAASTPASIRLHHLIEGVLATSGGVAAMAAFIDALRRVDALDPMLETLRLVDPLRAVFATFSSGVITRQLARPWRIAIQSQVRVSSHWLSVLARWLARWSGGDPRSQWLTAAALVAEKPSRLASPSLPEWVAALVAELDPTGRVAPAELLAGHVVEQAPCPPTASSSLGSEEPPTPPDFTATPLRHTDVRPPATGYAGLLFVVHILARLGFPRLLERDPGLIEAGLPALLFRHLAERLGMRARDPILSFLEDYPGPPLALPLPLDFWFRATRRWLRRHGRLKLPALVRRTGRVAVTRTHIDLFLPLRDADIRIRKAGLDVDPGWVPWLGRVIHFHYQS